MLSVAEPFMARKSKPDKEEKPTTHIRVHKDLADMIGWICRVEKGSSSAQLLDPMVRPQITARYNKYLPLIRQLMAAEAEVERLEKEAAENVRKQSRR